MQRFQRSSNQQKIITSSTFPTSCWANLPTQNFPERCTHWKWSETIIIKRHFYTHVHPVDPRKSFRFIVLYRFLTGYLALIRHLPHRVKHIWWTPPVPVPPDLTTIWGQKQRATEAIQFTMITRGRDIKMWISINIGMLFSLGDLLWSYLSFYCLFSVWFPYHRLPFWLLWCLLFDFAQTPPRIGEESAYPKLRRLHSLCRQHKNKPKLWRN